jgi:hypothetical protein
MTSVALVVTGQLEHLALPQALGRIFPGVEFHAEPVAESFTSTCLTPTLPQQTTNADKLARSLIAAVDPGRARGRTPADFAIAIDDLELANAHHPEVVLDYFREALRRQLDTYWSSANRADKTRRIIQERCSFHLLVPMVESYFFAEADALVRAGAVRASTVDHLALDLEQFESTDPLFLSPELEHAYWATADRARHPKRYLQFLCDPEGQETRRYRETQGGVKALRDLAWEQVLNRATSVQFLRSLLDDLADALGVSPPHPGDCHALTVRRAGRGVLRNL